MFYESLLTMGANIFTPLRFYIILIVFISFSCKKSTETDDFTYSPDRLTELMPLQTGKTITYKTDSTVFTNFGRTTEIHSYIETDSIISSFIDATGRASYRITRSLRNAAGTASAFSGGDYFITPTNHSVEVIENNLRFLKLILPVKQDVTWKGNTYLPDNPFESFDFSNSINREMGKWDYAYTTTNDVFDYNGTPINNIVTVTGIVNSNYPDTITVVNNTANLSDKSLVYLRGSATDIIGLTAAIPANPNTIITIYNRTNQPAQLGDILVPPNRGRSYVYINGKWDYGNGTELLTELQYATSTILVEKYAKGIGLVYQEFAMWEYQDPTINNMDDGYKKGFIVKRKMINHN